MSREQIKKARKIVLKIGTKALFNPFFKDKDLKKLIKEIVSYKKKGYEFIIVSSGAVFCGMEKLKLKNKPKSLRKKQALASIGQNILMNKWANTFKQHNIPVSQVLFTYDIVENRQRFVCTQNCFSEIKEYNAIPIVNENDSISVEELNFGDNDNLSVFTSLLIDADLLILFTDIDGIFNKNPHKYKNAKRISYIKKIDESIFAQVEDKESDVSKGGMKSKLHSAKHAIDAGISVVIANGKNFALDEILKAKDVGTFIEPKKGKGKEKRNWLIFNEKIKGKIFVDNGAKKAILENRKSLLPIGITRVTGEFSKGAVIGVFDEVSKLFARGISFYSNSEIEKTKGLSTKKIQKIFNNKTYAEVIDRNNMIILRRALHN